MENYGRFVGHNSLNGQILLYRQNDESFEALEVMK